MATDIVMPRLSDSMEEGTILSWLKSVGDEVTVGDELVEIETDKANMVYEADAAGTLIEITAPEGETLAIGQVIARVGESGEAPADADGAAAKPEQAEAEEEEAKEERAPETGAEPEEAEEAEEAEPAPALASPATATAEPPAPEAPPAVEAPARPEGDGRVKASPLARRIARERGLDLAQLQGSGPGGRIVKADVERAEAPAAAPEAPAPAAALPGVRERPETAKGEVEVIELNRLQQTIARRMAESKATAPHFYLSAEIDMGAAFEARSRVKAAASEGDIVPSLNDLVVKACALALRDYPRANGAYKDGKLELYSRVNVGVAVAAREALVVPTIFDADRKGLRQIAAEARVVAERVREGSITPPELSGGTFTVSNLGMYGISNFSAVINPPQAAILAVGEIADRAVVRDGELTVAKLMGVTLACDHRILYGADAAQFLGRIRGYLEEPLSLAL
jgi:pyruvate dehydrogenase E2 component (dihydrolipoamide acetyltransferase)